MPHPLLTVVRADQSPMNASRWCLVLQCGHEHWVTAMRRPKASRVRCERCTDGIEHGELIVSGANLGPAERDRHGRIDAGPHVQERASRRKRAGL